MIPSAVGVRLIRERSGESRGFAFVEFASVHDAQKFLEGGTVRIGGRVLHLEYSRGQADSHPKMDWVCNVNGCDGFNFARRTSCFQCGAQKDSTFATHLASDDTRDSMNRTRDIYDSNVPSSVLVVRGLDAVTDEETIRFAFQSFGVIKEVRLVRDKLTNQSRGFCFVSFDTVEAATEALAGSVGLRIGNANVRVSYSAESRDSRGGPGQRKKGGPPPKRPANIAATFTFDDATGYWFDQLSRFYYNDMTQLYYHSDSGIYYRWDVVTGAYVQTDERGVLMSAVKKEEDSKEKKKKVKPKKEEKPVSIEETVIPPVQEKKAKPIDKAALLGSIKFSLKSVNKDLVRWKKIKDEQEADKKRQEEVQLAAVIAEQSRIAARTKADLERAAAAAAVSANPPSNSTSKAVRLSTPSFSVLYDFLGKIPFRMKWLLECRILLC